MSSIDHAHPVLKPVRAAIDSRIAELTAKVVSTRTPLENVPMHRGEIAALNWLRDQLAPPKDVTP